jgi:uncharacterized protein (DUF58 family)
VAVRAAASLAHWALANEGMASLAAAGSKGPVWAHVDRLDGEFEILELLARVQADGPMPASAVLEWAGERLNPDTNIVLLTSSPDDRLAAVISGLRRRSENLAVVLLDAHSFDPRAPHTAALAPSLEAAGARVVVLHGELNLREALSRVLSNAD